MSSIFSSYVLEPVARRARRHSSNPNEAQQSRNGTTGSAATAVDSSPRATQSGQLSPISRRSTAGEVDTGRRGHQDGTQGLLSLDNIRRNYGDVDPEDESEEEPERTPGVARVPEVARQNGLQGLIALSDIRGDYLPDEPLSPGSPASPAADSRITAEPASIIDGRTMDSFSSMSLDNGPPTQSSNPSFDVEERLWPNGVASSHDSTSRMSIDGRSRASADQIGPASREGSVSGGSTRSGSLPADDGMKELRAKIRQIRDMALSSDEKARRMHNLMTADYKRFKAPMRDKHSTRPSRASRSSRSYHSASSVSMQDEEHKYHVKPRDLQPTYYPRSPILSPTLPDTGEVDDSMMEEDQSLGCDHYMRNIKVQCVDCRRWYPCRFCHDEVEDHRLERNRIQNMLCMLCGTPQPAAESCSQCGHQAATYYCEICKLWDNDPRKRIYHCADCGICRRGEGLGRDYFHCKRCNVCISIRWAEEHRCVERATECDCPICGEYMFTSSGDVVAVRCGHYMHKACYKAYMETNFRCPTCGRSMVNMALQWRKLDDQIANQPMPSEFAATQAFVSCNDCAGKSCVPYHWLGLKCATCDSYNTVRLRLINAPAHERVVETVPAEVTAGDAVRARPSSDAAVGADSPAPPGADVPLAGSAAPQQDSSAPGPDNLSRQQPDARQIIPIAASASPVQVAHSPTGTNSTVVVSYHGGDDNEVEGDGVMLDADDLSGGDDDDGLEDDDDDDDGAESLDFWGAAGVSPGWISPPSWMSPSFLAARYGDGDKDVKRAGGESSSDESMDEDDEDEDEEDAAGEEVDEMELFGHR